MVAKTKHTIPSRKVDGKRIIPALRARITRFERRYELSYEDMLKSGQTRDAPEVLKWAQGHHALQSYERAIRTGGKTTNDTK